MCFFCQWRWVCYIHRIVFWDITCCFILIHLLFSWFIHTSTFQSGCQWKNQRKMVNWDPVTEAFGTVSNLLVYFNTWRMGPHLLINPNSRGLYTHYKDIPIKGGMNYPQIKELIDPGAQKRSWSHQVFCFSGHKSLFVKTHHNYPPEN